MEELEKLFEETVKRKFDELKEDSQTYGEFKLKAFQSRMSYKTEIAQAVFFAVERMVESEMKSILVER